MKYIIAILIAFLTMLGITCGNQAPELDYNSTSTYEGITVTLTDAQLSVNKNGAYVVEVDANISNDANAPEGIMEVKYTLTLLNADGEELHSATVYYDKQDRAIAPGETVTDTWKIQRKVDTKPAAVTVEIKSVQTESELPPVHLPQKGEPLYRALSNDKLQNIKNEPPIKIEAGIDQGGYLRVATFAESEELATATKLFCDITVGEETEEWVTDNYNYIVLTWPDETTTFISINLYNLEFSAHGYWHVYELDNLGPFWSYVEKNAQETDTYRGDDA